MISERCGCNGQFFVQVIHYREGYHGRYCYDDIDISADNH